MMNTHRNSIVRTFQRLKTAAVLALSVFITVGCSLHSKRPSNQDSTSQDLTLSNQYEHEVSNGDEIRELLEGDPLPAFSAGGEKEEAFEDFIEEQKVAGFIVLHNGKIRLERYARGHSDSARWSSLSVAKSVTSTLVGAAIKDGYINSLDDYVTDYLPNLKGSAYDSVRVRHLLTMTTGVKWNEKYEGPDSDIVRFDQDSTIPGVKAIVSYMRRLPSVAQPGKKFNYSTGETHLLGTLISSATQQTLSDYLSAKIWMPYGMEQTALWRLNSTGDEMAGCCLEMRLRDFARFGQFVLEGGQIKGESVVPDDWFETATKIQVQLWPGGGYGYGWWIFNNYSFQALGIHGQLIYIDPSRNLVIAVNSEWPEADSYERQVAVTNFIQSIAKEIDKE